MSKAKVKVKYSDKSIEDWNVNDFHAYIIETTKEKFGVDYVPFGRGSLRNKWASEKGQLKQAQGKLGNEVLYNWILFSMNNYRPTPQYPFITFGFMNAYRKEDIARVQAELAMNRYREEEIVRQQSTAQEVDESWF